MKRSEAMLDKLSPYWALNDYTASCSMAWDAFNTYIRGHYILAIKSVKAKYASQTLNLESCELAATFAASQSKETYSALAQAQRDFPIHFTSLTIQIPVPWLINCLSGDKNDRLANLVAEPRFRTVISEITSPSGLVISEPSGVLANYCERLHSLVSSTSATSLQDTLRALHLPSLSEVEAGELDKEISVTEIKLPYSRC